MMDARLIKLLEEYGCADTGVDGNTRLYHDLKICGDDAFEFLARFGNQFNVDLSAFRFAYYFPCEGDWIMPSVFRFLIGKKAKQYKPITLYDLHRSIVAGYLA